MRIKFGRTKYGIDVIMTAIRIYLSYPNSYRDVEEIMKEQGIDVDHTTIYRWIVKYVPRLLNKFRKYKLNVGEKWHLDETYIKVGGVEHYLYRAVDCEGRTIDFKLYKTRNKAAAKRYLAHAIKNNGTPKKVNIDGSLANEAGIKKYNKKHDEEIIITKVKYLNNIVEQDHRNIKRKTRSIQTFKNFYSAQITLAGIEMVKMLKKGQAYIGKLFAQNYIDEFHELAYLK